MTSSADSDVYPHLGMLGEADPISRKMADAWNRAVDRLEEDEECGCGEPNCQGHDDDA